MIASIAVEFLPTSEVTPNPRNSRKHSAGQIADIVKSILEFGWTSPLLIDESGLLLAGHGRLMAAKRAGIDSVPCIRKLGLTEAQKRAYVIADNQLGLGSEWDEKILKMELRDLMALDFDVGVLGFDGEALNDMLAEAYEESTEGESAGWSEEDDVSPAPATPVSRPGDLWVMGRHRLLCGDSTSSADMARLVAGAADLWLTDPPYNVAYTGGTQDKLTIKNDDMGDTDFRRFLVAAYSAADSVMRPGAAFYIWHADSEGSNFRAAARDVGWPIRQCLIWRKNTLVMGRQDYQWQHEPCLYGWKLGAAHQWNGGRKQTTVRDLAASGAPLVQVDDQNWQLTVGGGELSNLRRCGGAGSANHNHQRVQATAERCAPHDEASCTFRASDAQQHQPWRRSARQFRRKWNNADLLRETSPAGARHGA